MATGRGVRGPYAKSQARRADILHKALEAFAERGFQGSSLREIAEAVGLSQAGVLHHFSSKEALLAAVIAEKDAASLSHFESAVGIGVLEGLREVVVSNLAQPGLVRLFTTLSAEAINAEHPAHDYFQERYARSRRRLARALHEGQTVGEVNPSIDAGAVASALLAVMDGLQVQWLLEPSLDVLAGFDAALAALQVRVPISS
ncbi:MAG: putative TetR-family transcriptional regulator [Frankiales bacterium]|nr:putative TetR-family transcriptional regulator [Frankiales bacterium]